jgi:hypothetical protein
MLRLGELSSSVRISGRIEAGIDDDDEWILICKRVYRLYAMRFDCIVACLRQHIPTFFVFCQFYVFEA